MKILRCIPIVSLLIVLAAGYADAGEMTVSVKNQFKVGDQVFPAGNYRIRGGHSIAEHILIIRNVDTGSESKVRYITRISQREGSKGAVVFDLFQGDYYLSEIHFPMEDGYQLQGAPGDHSHVVSRANESK
jgi:hypothetical protein